MDFLYDIPLLGYLFQFIGYVIDVLPIIAPTIIGASVAIALGALCGFMNERSGVVNIGIEGMMLTAAFVAWWSASITAQLIPDGPAGPLGVSAPLLIGLIVALRAAMVVMLLLLFRSRWGRRTRAVGEHPEAAETVGIDVIGLRYRNVILGGVFAGLAGAYLTIEFGNSFQGEMTKGPGFIAP